MPSLLQISVALALSIGSILLLTRYLKLHAFFTLLTASLLFGLVIGKTLLETLTTMQAGFGSLLQQIGLLVAVGSCLGMLMEKTGAMETISHTVLRAVGPQRTVFAMSVVGIIVGIPVFCDSGFIILSRLIPSIASQAMVNPAQLALALSGGLYTTHTLVPPTPGPLAAAANLQITEHIGQVIGVGIVTSLAVGFVSYQASKRLGLKIPLPDKSIYHVQSTPQLQAWKAFLPLALPIVLIALSSFPKFFTTTSAIGLLLQTLGNPVVALLIGLAFASLLVKKTSVAVWPDWIAEALKDAGVILLITGAGGAFGAVVKTSGIDMLLKDLLTDSNTQGLIFLTIGFLLAAMLKTAQGSTTSAMIIASSLLAPLAATSGLVTPMQLSLLIVSIGGGAMTVSHANDSYFWVVSQFGKLEPRDAFRTFTLLTLIQGLTAYCTAVLLFFVV